MTARGYILRSTDGTPWLNQNDCLVSQNGAFCAYLHIDGNLVIYPGSAPGQILTSDNKPKTLWWASDTSDSSKWKVGLGDVQQPKRLVLYNTGVICCDNGDPSHQIWSHNPEVDVNQSPRNGGGAKCMVLHDDGNLCCYASANPDSKTMIWDTGSKFPIVGTEISDIEYHLREKKLYLPPDIQGLYLQTVENGTSKEQNTTLSVSETVIETQSWTQSNTVGVTLSQSVKIMVPKVAEGDTKLSIKAERTLTFNKTEQVSREWKLDVPLNVPANTTVTVTLTVAMTAISVPYTATGTYTLSDNTKIPGVKISGMYFGNNSHDLRVNYVESSDAKVTPPETITKPQPENKAVVVADAVHIRAFHSAGAKILGFLKKQDEIVVLDTWIQGNQIWVRLKPGPHLQQPDEQWCAMLVGSNKYVQLLNDSAE